MSPRHRQEDDAADVLGLVDLARGAVQERAGELSGEWQLDRLVRAQTIRNQRGFSRSLVFGIGGATVVAAGMLLLFVSGRSRILPPSVAPPSVGERSEPAQLSYTVKTGPSDVAVLPQVLPRVLPKRTAPGADTRAGAGVVNRYAFSDGTSISATDGSVQVVDSQSNHPRIRISQNQAHVRVVHRPGTHWTFSAGPFDVEVVGTDFDLGWDPRLGSFFLRMHEGAVDVRGPSVRGAVRVLAGQSVSASSQTGQVAITNPVPEAVPGVTNGAAEAPQTVTASEAAPAPARPPSSAEHAVPAGKVASTSNWRTLVARGQFDQVISEAQARPLRVCLASCASEELRALGDAARYSKHPRVAERALVALRERFPGTSDGTVAAFLLGRIYESRGQPEQSGHWYARYLAEAPEGEFAVEAAAGRARVGSAH